MSDPDTSNDSTDLGIVLLDRQRGRRIPRDRIGRVLVAAAARLGVGGELTVVMTGDRRMRELNRDFRGLDRPTDVLSFPGPGGREGLGDVVISVETAARNARRLGWSLAQELEVLALHGFLHVLGYDHETDDGAMSRLERRLRGQLLGEGRPRQTGRRSRARVSRPGSPKTR